jgi:rubredoxin
MAIVVAHADAAATRKPNERRPMGVRWNTTFMTPPAPDVPQDPHAFLVESTKEDHFGTHFHRVDEFQVVLRGGGNMGKHALVPGLVHFARADTPYGPIGVADEGLQFLTLRACKDGSGAHFFPKGKETLLSITDRDPWQVSEHPVYEKTNNAALRPFASIKDERGLAAYTIALAPGAKTSAPDPATTAGQYLLITGGSLKYQGKEHAALTIIFVKSTEKPFELEAGAQGLNALVLNFPKSRARRQVARPAGAFRVWQCRLCAFVYDEAKGMPDEGVAPGTSWNDVPDTWSCPDCAAMKADFDMQAVG